MKKNKIILFVLILLLSCTEEKKKCNFQQKNIEMSIYNDVLVELVEEHFYHRYLGKSGEEIMSKRYSESIDSVQEVKQVTNAHNKLFSDSSLLRTIYLLDEYVSDSATGNNYNYYSHGKSKSVDKMSASISSNSKNVLDSISFYQFRFKAKDFHACTFKVKSISDKSIKNFDNEIGLVSFSKIFINKNEAILRCDFNCGGLCGKGYILRVRKYNNHWKIIDWDTIWVS
jgi:phosphorylcholine metabolism protein LicD